MRKEKQSVPWKSSLTPFLGEEGAPKSKIENQQYKAHIA